MPKEKPSSKIKILLQEKDFVVIDKPAGLLMHGDGKTDEKKDRTELLTDWILKNFPEMGPVGEEGLAQNGLLIARPGIVHRLDRESSGVLILARNQKSYLSLKTQFQERSIKKVYRAFVYGELKKEKGEICSPIGRSKNFGRWTAIPKARRGKERTAVSRFEVLEKSPDFSFLELRPETGRTHQLRVHLQYLNYPVVADFLYAGKRYKKEDPEANLFFQRQALHAFSLEFQGIDGKKFKVESELPQDFQEALVFFRKRKRSFL